MYVSTAGLQDVVNHGSCGWRLSGIEIITSTEQVGGMVSLLNLIQIPLIQLVSKDLNVKRSEMSLHMG